MGITPRGEYVIYDLIDLTPTNYNIKKESPSTASDVTDIGSLPRDPLGESITQKSEEVKREFSISPSENTETAKQHFGTTKDWAETGYLLTDGSQLDFSGRHWGGDGGYSTDKRLARIIQHRY